jgi:hypothetical protein
MEDLQPQEIEELLPEVEEEDDWPELASSDVEGLLHVLQHGRRSDDRWDAAERLGRVEASSPRMVQALVTASESDPFPEVRRAAANSLRVPAHQAFLARESDLREAVKPVLAPPDSAGGWRRDLGANRLGLVNAALSGLVIVAVVASLVLGAFGVGGEGSGMFFGLMLIFFIPMASIPIGLSCLVGVVRSGIALRRHSSREARIGLWLSLGGPIAVIGCYALLLAITLLNDLLAGS